MEVLEAALAATTVRTTKENGVDEVSHAGCSPLGKNVWTAMKMLLVVIALACKIYDVDFRSLVEILDSGAGEVINRETYLMLVGFL